MNFLILEASKSTLSSLYMMLSGLGSHLVFLVKPKGENKLMSLSSGALRAKDEEMSKKTE